MRKPLILTALANAPRILTMVGLFVFALSGLVIALLAPAENDLENHETNTSKTKIQIIEPEQYLGKDLPDPNLEKLVNFCINHTTADRGFVIFSNGTCVLIPEPCEDPLTTAREMLANNAKPEARFLTERTTDGDLIVTFQNSVFHWVGSYELEAIRNWAEANLHSLFSPEEMKTIKPNWTPPMDARVGLVSRKRLLADGSGMEIVKILRPNTSVAALGKK
ncbi:hypothetical protein [Luteolibacter sp. AS25]|uniref:hypothetical protein n=1 Tax=Luteolibacter sp. AS25 TaxID=3135776 RepID=UPI00398B5D22